MHMDVAAIVQSCHKCQIIKPNRETMTITDTPQNSFDKIIFDTVGPFLISNNGNQYVVTIICHPKWSKSRAHIFGGPNNDPFMFCVQNPIYEDIYNYGIFYQTNLIYLIICILTFSRVILCCCVWRMHNTRKHTHFHAGYNQHMCTVYLYVLAM